MLPKQSGPDAGHDMMTRPLIRMHVNALRCNGMQVCMSGCHQRTSLMPETGNLTFHSRPVLAGGAKGEISIASMFWQLFNRTAPDGAPFLHVRSAAHSLAHDKSQHAPHSMHACKQA